VTRTGRLESAAYVLAWLALLGLLVETAAGCGASKYEVHTRVTQTVGGTLRGTGDAIEQWADTVTERVRLNEYDSAEDAQAAWDRVEKARDAHEAAVHAYLAYLAGLEQHVRGELSAEGVQRLAQALYGELGALVDLLGDRAPERLQEVAGGQDG
jgi:hypothetical protein